MPKQIQYQAKTQPVSTSPEAVHADAWVQPQVQPTLNFTWKAARYAAAIIATGMCVRSIPFNAASAAEVVHADAWVQPQSQPYPYPPLNRRWNSAKLGVHPSEMPFFFKGMPFSAASSPEVVHVDAWQQPQIQPDRNFDQRGRRYEAAIDSCDGIQTAGYALSPLGLIECSWDPVFEDTLPRLRTVRAAKYQAAWDSCDGQGFGSPFVSTTPETIFEAHWHPVWPQPDFGNRAAKYRQVVDSCDGTQVSGQSSGSLGIAEGSWDPVFPDLVRTRSGLSAALQASDGAVSAVSQDPEVVTEDRWHQPASQPYPYKRVLQTPEQLSFVWHVSTAPEQVSEDKWHQPCSQPYPYRKYTPAAVYPYLFANFDAPQEEELEDLWHQPVSQPYPYRRTLHPSRTPALFADTDSTTAERWIQPQSQPYPYRKQLTEAIDSCDGQAFIGQPPAAEVVTEDRWHPNCPQPYPYQRRLQAALNPASFWNTFTPAVVEVVTVDKWFNAGSQPYPYRRALQTADQLALVWHISTAKEVVTEDRWHAVWSQPDFSARARRYAAALVASGMQPWQISTAKETVTADRWVQPQSQPYPYRHALSAAIQACDGALDGGAAEPISEDQETVSEDRWHQPVSQPYPYRGALGTAQQQATFWHVSTAKEVVTEDRWHQPPSQPYPNAGTARERRYAAAQRAGMQPWHLSLAKETVTEDRWHQPQSQPVRLPWRDAVYSTASVGSVFTPVTAEVVTVDKWFQPTSQPQFRVYCPDRFLSGNPPVIAETQFIVVGGIGSGTGRLSPAVVSPRSTKTEQPKAPKKLAKAPKPPKPLKPAIPRNAVVKLSGFRGHGSSGEITASASANVIVVAVPGLALHSGSIEVRVSARVIGFDRELESFARWFVINKL